MVFAFTLLFRELPLVGGLFRVPLFGFFLTAILLSTVGARAAQWIAQRRALSRDLADLGIVDTPNMRGKLGRLLLLNGRPRQALEPLSEALAADETDLEWTYRLGMARRLVGEAQEATRLLARVTQVDERYAYGEPWLQLALCHLDLGKPTQAVEALERFERLQGATPQQVFWLGCAIKASGRKEDARAVFNRLPELVKQAPKYQRAAARQFLLRSYLTRL